MFVTSTTYLADLGGLPGADAKCRERAQAAGLPGTFIALLSTTTVDARSRLGQSRGWVRVDGRPFADAQSSLFSSIVYYPPVLDEFGVAVLDLAFGVFTGSYPEGTRAQYPSDWGAQVPGGCIVGRANGGGKHWLYSLALVPCHPTAARLYCFETGRNVAVDHTRGNPSPVRTAFTTRGTFNPSSGLSAADALCAREAAAASLSGRYRAFLATSIASAISRFDRAGPPWIRPDGVRIADSAGDIVKGALAVMEIQADQQILQDNVNVWTGADSVDGRATDNCRDWTSAAGSDLGTSGTSTMVGADWFVSGYRRGRMACDTADLHLYCFQE